MTERYIRAWMKADWPAAAAIYEEGIQEPDATFEEIVPDWDDWDRVHLQRGRLMVETAGVMAAWTALAPVSARRAYAGAAEVSIYAASWARGQGIGKELLAALEEEAAAAGIWTLQATIFADNEPSLRLHSRAGFRTVGRREKIARKNGCWKDTIIMEKRSRWIGREESEHV
ncbi:GNAT family N-acetyltransferase [Alkalicoccus chagannorensis]|uniref:GNAT family N-acetyltransferase n=1 Tax=Alkalicoccus chagannorensis TaxID=427072 RepID=UPI00047CE93C|nr:GNAT family N-acetyltransferase [Alkalicoccus chagannorensis]